jgi:hypothetical protein
MMSLSVNAAIDANLGDNQRDPCAGGRRMVHII